MYAAQRFAVVYLEPASGFLSPHNSVREALLRDLPDFDVETVGSSLGAMYIRFCSPAEREVAMRLQPFWHDDVRIDLVREEEAERLQPRAQTLALIAATRFPAEHINPHGIATAFASFGEVLEIDPVLISGSDLALVTAVVLLISPRDVPCDIWTNRAPWKGRVISVSVLRVWPKGDSFNEAGEYHRFFGPPLLPPFAHNLPPSAGRHLAPAPPVDVRRPARFAASSGVVRRLLGWRSSLPRLTSPCSVRAPAPSPTSTLTAPSAFGGGLGLSFSDSESDSLGSSTISGGVTITELPPQLDDAPPEVHDLGLSDHARRKTRGKAKRAADAAHRTSARLAGKEAANHVDMTTKASKLRGLRDALIGCSPKLQAKVAKGKLLGVSCKPMGARTIADLRDSVVPCTIPVSNARDV
jgi:hypothetical protein